MPRNRPSPAFFLIPAMALVAVLPLILRGCSCGHDFDFHLLSWFEAAAQFRSGNLHPAWAFSPAFNAGEPRFVFYPPLSWTLGAVLGLAIPWAYVPIVYTWLAFTAAGATMYRLARQFSGANGALLTAALYIVNPYMLFNAYERTAYAELLAATWMPLLLAAALRERVTILRVAIPVALLWLTNAPAAVMGCYSLALITLVRIVQTFFSARGDSPVAASMVCAKLALRLAAGTGLGLALAAFYIIPAAYERRWVQIAMATISGMRITDNFLFEHTSDANHDQVLQTASIIAVILLAAAIAAFAAAIVRSREHRGVLTPLAILCTAIALMLTPASGFIWRVAPEMAFLQFPWRLLAVLTPAVCVSIAISFRHLKNRSPIAALAALAMVAAITFPAVSIFRQPCDDEDTVAARLDLFNSKSGTDPTDEYTPSAAGNDSLAHTGPAFWLAEDPGSEPTQSGLPSPVPMRFTTSAPEDETLILNLRDYPAWQVKINGSIPPRAETRDDGLIAVPVQRGPVQVDIAYLRGRDRTLGDGTSSAALVAALALACIRRRGPAYPRVSS